MLSAVTGSAGFIGTHLVRALEARSDEVRQLDRKTSVDLLSSGLAEHLEGVEIVFHLAGQPGVRDSFGRGLLPYLTDNMLATEVLLEAASLAGVRRLVFASSSSVYGPTSEPVSEDAPLTPASPYGVTKLACEELCRISDVECAVLRYFTVYGPGQRPDMAFSRFIRAAQRGEPLSIYGDGSQIRDFTYVEDAVAATIAAAEVSGTFNIAGGSQASLLDATQILEDLLGPLELEHTEPVAGDVRRTAGDISKARSELDYEPRTPLRKGLAAQCQSP